MNLPRSLKIGPHHFKVIVDRYGLMEGDKVGACNVDRHVIAIDPRLVPSAQADTLVHETVHALLATIKLDEEIEEAIALILGTTPCASFG